ncbi:hypothetical protein [Sporolactobacillus inulinus]|uniref:Uncharacterized protein n=3 Tax=Sporolactobacillus inulinus TaxID=2078 RepID=A0A0U1QSG2_9BACL|nr:hypothetical protein [Sporolactobacillus inulinus]KLI03738.1 hypothetical protein SINU_01250 [Sporolactobacillus inulinus CASD]GEB77749.1 hypothetical protein SIN01_20940 [Sporolactobacillus inulinus]
MYKLIEFFKYIFLVCYWKVTDLWKKAWGKKSSNMPDYMSEQRTDPTLLNIKDTHSLFASPTRDATVFMSEPIFEKIVHSLPTSYTFPDLSTLSNIEKCYAKTTAVEKDAERNGEPSVSKIKAELPNDDTTLTPSAVMKPNRSKHLNQRIHFAKTTTANIAFEPKASSLSSDENKTAAVPKTEPALIITPLQSSKKIIEPVDQNSKSSKTGHYKFVFIK